MAYLQKRLKIQGLKNTNYNSILVIMAKIITKINQ